MATTTKSATVEIQIDHKNKNVSFPPLDRKVRGAFDVNRERDPHAAMLRDRVPFIPGQIIGCDPEAGTGWITDPLADDPKLVEFVRNRGERVPPAREEFTEIDVAEWCHWIGRLATDGKGKVVTGTAPDVSPSYVPRSPIEPRTRDARRSQLLRNDPKLAWEFVNAPKEKRAEFESLMGLR